MKLLRLRGRKICDAVQRKGQVWKGKTMMIRWMSGAPKHPAVDPLQPAFYVGTVVSAKTDPSAVQRNRMRRRCREALRVSLSSTDKLPTLQLLIAPRSSSLKAPFADILADIRLFLSFHGRSPSKEE